MNKHTIAIAAALLLGCGAAMAQTTPAPLKGWLHEAPSDAERFTLLQRYLRGFDQPMWEVGERYRLIHDALGRDNFELAQYHWDKIKVTVQNGYLKRPGRKANADALFLNAVWSQVNTAFASKQPKLAWVGFDTARSACMGCHAAEKVAYINNQGLFDLSVPGSVNR